jgi:hypothetical protein
LHLIEEKFAELRLVPALSIATMTPMRSESSGSPRLWLGKHRLQPGDQLVGTRALNIGIGTIIRSFSFSGEICIGKFCF